MKTLANLLAITKRDSERVSRTLTLERVKVLNKIEYRLGVEDEEKEIAIVLNDEDMCMLETVIAIERTKDFCKDAEKNKDVANKQFNKDYIQQRDSLGVNESIDVEIGRGK